MSNPIINDDLAKAEEAESSSGDAPPPTRVNMLPTPEEARRIRKAKANNYRTYYLLPRYVVEEDGKKRKLEAGEFVENSKLYSIFTPLRDMSDFGIGVGMYFTTTWWLGLLLVICALIQTPTANYFASQQYDAQNEHDRAFSTLGSASCVDEQRVCLDANCTIFAGEFQYAALSVPRYWSGYSCSPSFCPFRDDALPYTYDDFPRDGYSFARVDKEISEDSSDRTYVGKRRCELKRWFGYVDFVIVLLIIGVLLILGWRQNREAEALDLAEQTAQDYSVLISDPNPECLDPDEWKDFFESHFGPGKVTYSCVNPKPPLMK